MPREVSLLQDPFLDKEQLSFAKSALRAYTFRWKPLKEVMKENRVELPPLPKKDGSPGKRVRVRRPCNSCKKLFSQKQLERDHIEPVIRLGGPPQTLGEYASRLYVPKQGWQLLCVPCHDKKSAAEGVVRRKRKK